MTTFLATWKDPGQVAIENAWTAYSGGKSLASSLVAGLTACEEDERFLLVGRGSLPNSDGELELDAAIMDGADLSAGAICALRGIGPAIQIAEKVKDETPHMMLAGDQAKRFAIECGFEPRNMMTEESCRRYEEWRKGPEHAARFVHSIKHHGDTVTMLALEEPGHLVAASSTSGIAWKQPGRVGDSPIVGAGVYADDEVGCAGATGLGEELWKACASFRVCEAMRRGLSAQEACEDTVLQMLRRQPAATKNPCVVLALRRDGDVGAATTHGEFELWIGRDGMSEMKTFSPLG